MKGRYPRQGFRPVSIRRDRRGLSLLELIVAVTILALVMSPLLHTIVTAGRLSRRTANMGDATLAAQNLVETTLATAVNNLMENTPWDTSQVSYYQLSASGTDIYTPLDGEQESGRCFIALKGISPTASGERYDALLSLDATGADNGIGVTQYTPMDAVFAQPYAKPSGGSGNPDLLAVERLIDNAQISIGNRDVVPGSLRIDGTQKRIITISVTLDTETKTIKATAEYHYHANYNYSYYDWDYTDIHNPQYIPYSASQYSSVDFVYEFYNTRYSESQDPQTALKNLFFFYYPVYEPGETDEIIIKNNLDLEVPEKEPLLFDIYLIKQRQPKNEDGSTPPEEPYGYTAQVSLHQNPVHPFTLTDGTLPAIHTNLYESFVSGGDLPGCPKGFSAYVGMIVYRNRPFAPEGLLKTDTANRIYDLTLRLYPAGTLRDGDIDLGSLTPLVTLTGTKLE